MGFLLFTARHLPLGCHHVHTATHSNYIWKNGEEKEAVLAKIDPTDVILFDSDIIHKSVANVGKRIRVTGIVRALDICSNSKILPIQEMKNLNAKEYTE